MKLLLFFLAVSLLLNACNSTRHWTGTSNLKSTQAAFEELNGKQSFTILVPDEDTYLKYHFAINSGELETIIKSPTERVLKKKLRAVETDSIHLVNQKGNEYKIYLNGKQASGNFDIRFTNNGD